MKKVTDDIEPLGWIIRVNNLNEAKKIHKFLSHYRKVAIMSYGITLQKLKMKNGSFFLSPNILNHLILINSFGKESIQDILEKGLISKDDIISLKDLDEMEKNQDNRNDLLRNIIYIEDFSHFRSTFE